MISSKSTTFKIMLLLKDNKALDFHEHFSMLYTTTFQHLRYPAEMQTISNG